MATVVIKIVTEEERKRNRIALAEHLKERKRQTQAEMREAYLLNPEKQQLINRSEEHTSELQSRRLISYAVFVWALVWGLCRGISR